LRRVPDAPNVSANARFRNEGAAAIIPNEAKAIPPDLIKYLLFMLVTSQFLTRNSKPET
jgi:hypothetical protein